MRVLQEIERRKVQQAARKSERKAAHQKHVSRVISKDYLEGLREVSIRHLADMGFTANKLRTQLVDRVIPWLYSKVD